MDDATFATSFYHHTSLARVDRSAGELPLAFFGGLQHTLPVQYVNRLVLVVHEPDRPIVGEIEHALFGEVREVVDHAVRLVAVVAAIGGNAAVLDAAADLHLAGDHVVFAGTQMLVPGKARALAAAKQDG